MANYINIPAFGSASWKTPVATATSLPTANNTVGDACVTQDTGLIYVWSGSAWVNSTGGGSGTVTSVGLSAPGALTVSGSPITSFGTLGLTWSSTTAGQYLRGSGTDVVLSAIQAADVPTLNQNTTGTAANITATSNSTLTTLSALSLPGSQVSGNITGNAANVTGTVAIANGGTNQTTFTAPVAGANPLVFFDGTSLNTDTSGDVSYNSTTNTLQVNALTAGNITKINNVTTSFPAAQGSALQVLTNDGSGNLTWQYPNNPANWFSTGSYFFEDFTVASVTASNGFYGYTGNLGSISITSYNFATDNVTIGVVSHVVGSFNSYTHIGQSYANTFGQTTLAGKTITLWGRANLAQLPTGSLFQYSMGYGNNIGDSTAQHSNGFYIFASGASTYWQAVSALNGTRTTVTTSVPLTTGWTKFQIVATGGSQIQYYINGTLAATITTNIPTTQSIGPSSKMNGDTGQTGTQTVHVDYIAGTNVLQGTR